MRYISIICHGKNIYIEHESTLIALCINNWKSCYQYKAISNFTPSYKTVNEARIVDEIYIWIIKERVKFPDISSQEIRLIERKWFYLCRKENTLEYDQEFGRILDFHSKCKTRTGLAKWSRFRETWPPVL